MKSFERIAKSLLPICAVVFVFTLSAACAGLQSNEAPQVALLEATLFVNESMDISYILYDEDDDTDGSLRYGLYLYSSDELEKVEDIRVFGWMVADQRDITLDIGTGDFAESRSAEDVQIYTWDDPGPALMRLGFAATTKMLEGSFYLYLVADDGVNDAVFTISDFSIKVDRTAGGGTASEQATAIAASSWGAVKASVR
ncbi:MAG: hypothetical protein HOC74_29370 [Gemmatimonadetes bacterium]|jgi:hypothetical protein|nr:hypothetical protein [Gemmatimonadota bacterium]